LRARTLENQVGLDKLPTFYSETFEMILLNIPLAGKAEIFLG
jgi:hypothetical protein